MNIVAVIDLFNFLASILAMILLLSGWKHALRKDVKVLLAVLILLLMFNGLSNVLEWSGITKALDAIEDFTEVVMPLMWIFIFYAFLQAMAGGYLQASEAKFKKLAREFNSLLDAIPDTIVLLSPDMKVVWASQGAADGIGKKAADLIGQSCYKLWHNRSTPCEVCPSQKSFISGQIEGAVISSPDGRVWDLRAVPIKNETGRIVSVIDVARDITEHRKLETQLRHSQKMESVGTLAGGVAHDFNNILTAIIGYGHLLLMKMDKDDPLKAYVEHILVSAERAAHLTQGLLAFSRKQIINPKPVNLNEIVKKVEKLMQRVISEDIELQTVLAEKDMTILADAAHIEQVLMNLVTNARDAMPDGGLLEIETGIAEIDESYINIYGYGEPGMYALVSVTDIGTGIDKEIQKRIFEPFFTTKEVGKGTGLGLSMAYGIIQQHNGYINCYSEIGKGTTFKIYLPLIKPEIRETKLDAVYSFTGGTETILLAEDEPYVRKLMKDVLEEFGYKAIEAEDGEDAVEKFIANKDTIQLLILDVVMPKMNGREAYERIKKIKPDIKTLFTSGYTANIIHKKGILDEGMNFIFKPVSPKDLMTKVREVLGK